METLKAIGGFLWRAINVVSWLASKLAGVTWGEAGQATAFRWATIVDWVTPGVPVGSALVVLVSVATLIYRKAKSSQRNIKLQLCNK